MMWRRLFPDLLREAFATSNTYVNAGFVGLPRKELNFLRMWSSVIERASPYTGGVAAWYSAEPMHPFSPFVAFDQDALNITLMANKVSVSIVGPEGMDFRPGGELMSHAIGPVKPWTGRFFWKALAGQAPSLADRYFVKYLAAGPLRAVSGLNLLMMRFDLLMAKMFSKLIY
jgi:hypothetical protein